MIYGSVPLGVLCDFLSKHWASRQFGGVEWMIRDLIGVFHVRHYGLWALDLAPGNRAALIVGVVATAALAVWAGITPKHRIARHGALACMLTGALGNTLERWWVGYVTDWLHFRFLPGGLTINFADICLAAGGVWLCLSILQTPAPHRPPDEV